MASTTVVANRLPGFQRAQKQKPALRSVFRSVSHPLRGVQNAPPPAVTSWTSLGRSLSQPLYSSWPALRLRRTTICKAVSSSGNSSSMPAMSALPKRLYRAVRAVRVSLATLRAFLDTPFMRAINQWTQFFASMTFVALYVYATYSPPHPGSWQSNLDLMLSAFFAIEYFHRLATEDSKLRMLTSFWNACDLLAFAPPLLEAALRQFTPFTLGRVDLRWFKILRSMRVMRIGLLASELRGLHLSTRKGGWLSAGANFRLFQLAASVFILLFTTSSVIQIVERMPFHQALYLVITTLTTVGFGDVVARTSLGKAVVLAMICMGVVLIPVQARQFYSEVMARRIVLGPLPDWRTPMVLLSARLTEVRAFSDFFSEFQQSLATSAALPRNTRMVVLCNRPSFEFRAFQELHERRITLMEGSAVSSQDLVQARAEKAKACMLLADRFTTDPEQEDLSLIFQVWACKSFTKTVPLYVQTVRQTTVDQIKPFLDPGQDVVVSMEQTRFRLLALSTVCPGASTLIGNLVKSSAIRAAEEREPTLASRRWLREYVNGCASTFLELPVPKHLVGLPFIEILQWLFARSGHVLIGVLDRENRLMLNPTMLPLEASARLLVVGTSERSVAKALKSPFVAMPEGERLRLADLLAAGGARLNGIPPGRTALSEGCVPLLVGNPDSESVDGEMVPCVPSSVARRLTSLEEVRAFVEQYRQNEEAQTQQAEYGVVSHDTAEEVAEVAMRQVAQSNGSLACPIDWDAMESYASGDSCDEDSSELSGHYIICGAEESFCSFLRYLRRCGADDTPVVILHPTQPTDLWCGGASSAASGAGSAGSNGVHGRMEHMGPVRWVQGSAADAASLCAAGASQARALVYLARSARPFKTAQGTGSALSEERGTREAVLADADALLACYGVGEESGAELTHAVVELLFTTSIEFLQPGLLLHGVSLIYGDERESTGQPRKSWLMRAWQQREAVAEGLAEWQANPYYVAGRVTVPALHDTFACACFFKPTLVDLLAELSGDAAREGHGGGGDGAAARCAGPLPPRTSAGAQLAQVPLPPGMAGRTYGELFMALAATNGLVCLGLYRRKTENPLTRLSYVVSCPPWAATLEHTDRVFVLRPR